MRDGVSSLAVRTAILGMRSACPRTTLCLRPTLQIQQRRIAALAPTHFEAPTGNRLPIDYEGAAPTLSIRVQELFGLDEHPAIAGGTVPLTLELLSPAHRPIQTTADLPRFWRGSWADVRADMRGRYTKHVWPEDPVKAAPTSCAKPRAR